MHAFAVVKDPGSSREWEKEELQGAASKEQGSGLPHLSSVTAQEPHTCPVEYRVEPLES